MITAQLAEPFASPGLAILDTLRLAVAGVGFVLCGVHAIAALDPNHIRTPARRLTAAGIAVAVFVLAGSRVTNIGAPITWQFFGACVAFLLFVASSETFRREDAERLGGER